MKIIELSLDSIFCLNRNEIKVVFPLHLKEE
jgi:hypothetical protein